jgi:hypothetical protein
MGFALPQIDAMYLAHSIDIDRPAWPAGIGLRDALVAVSTK